MHRKDKDLIATVVNNEPALFAGIKAMLLQNLHPNCWSDHRLVQRMPGSQPSPWFSTSTPAPSPTLVQRRCSSVVRRTANVAPELVQLERSCLADLSTEELELQLKLHGIPVRTRLPEVKQLQSSTAPTGTHGCNAQQAGGLHKQRQHQQNRQPQPQPQPRPQLQPQQESSQLVQQQNKQEQEAQQHTPRQHHQQLQPGPRVQQQQIKARARRVAASAARRALLLEQLANARVQARSRIVRLALRLSIAGRAKSRRYLTLPVDVEGAGFIDFLMDSSAYLSRITPGMRDKLGIGPVDGVAILTGGSSTSTSTSSRGTKNNSSSSSSRARVRQKVQLPKMWLGTAQLPPQQAFVTPLQLPPRQQQFRAAGSTVQRMAAVGAVGGVLGVQVLREFEIDIDFGGNSIALHPAGHVDLGLCDTRGMVEIPLRLTKTGALVIPVSLAGSSPFTGLLDLSAANSMLNWEAAALLGMTCKLDEDDEEQCGSSSGGGGGGSRSSQLAAQQQRQQQPAIKHVGKFGSLEVVPSDEMLLKPRLPAASPPQHSSRASNSPGRPGTQHPPLVPPRPAQQPGSSSSSSSGGTYSYRPLSSSSIVQQAQVAACEVRLVLGHARLAAATSGSNSNAAAVEGISSNSSSGITASLALPPPNRFGVAGLKAVEQLGLSGQPVMVVGWDVWARQRVVLCLKAGKVYLSAASS